MGTRSPQDSRSAVGATQLSPELHLRFLGALLQHLTSGFEPPGQSTGFFPLAFSKFCYPEFVMLGIARIRLRRPSDELGRGRGIFAAHRRVRRAPAWICRGISPLTNHQPRITAPLYPSIVSSRIADILPEISNFHFSTRQNYELVQRRHLSSPKLISALKTRLGPHTLLHHKNVARVFKPEDFGAATS
jgi:hypothetical protein